MSLISTEGFKEAAEKFRMESGIEPSVDLDSLDERIKIREMILKGQIQEAIALINSMHPELLDTNRYLYFHLQVKSRWPLPLFFWHSYVQCSLYSMQSVPLTILFFRASPPLTVPSY